MLLNRLFESLRGLSFETRLLRRRARAVARRTPVIVVPSVLGTSLLDPSGRLAWGGLRGVFGRFAVEPRRTLAPVGFLSGFTVAPGLYQYDVLGSLLRFLERVGGYRRGHDLHVLAYDWRMGVAAGASALAKLLARVRQAGTDPLDLVCISSGGLVARHYLAHGTRTIAEAAAGVPDDPAATEARAASVRRMVFLGTPQAGSFGALAALLEGVRFVPIGRGWRGHELASLPALWEMLPAPHERLFVDEQGQPVDADLFDVTTWQRLKLQPHGGEIVDLSAMLAHARAFHTAMESALPPKDVVVVAARNQSTRVRLQVSDGVARLPPCEPRRNDPHNAWLYQAGDGVVPAASACALPGLDPARVWWARPREHHRLPSDPVVQRYVLEALLATDRSLVATDLTRSRGPRPPGMPLPADHLLPPPAVRAP